MASRTNFKHAGLPPDPEGKNYARAAWAGSALRHFQSKTGTDYEDSLGDLLGDLMHWCDRNNFDFELALERARGHYEAETTDDTPDLLAALEQAVEALNAAPRFKVPGLDTDSYRIASVCDAAIRKARVGAS
jgi:hypothetical protein